MDDILTISLIIVLCVMFLLLTILIIVALNSKKKEKYRETSGKEKTAAVETPTKTYHVESVFDFMEFDKVEDNMICIKNGTKYVMVVECQGINYDLMSEMEKNSVEEGFIQFLNTLRHPIQIYTQTRTINLESSIQTYKSKVHEIEEALEKQRQKYNQMVASGRYTKEQLDKALFELTKQTNLYEYGKDIIYTTEKMSLNKNVLNQKYYVVIPYYPEDLGQNDFDKEELKNLAFSELYTRAQSIVRTLAVCGINAKVLDSNGLVDLLYVAYNRDDAEIYGVDKAIRAGYDELYSTAPDVLDKKMRELDRKIAEEAFEKANNKVIEAKSDKEKELMKKEESMDDLISQMARLIIEQNRTIVGEDIAERAIEKVNNEEKKKRGRKKKEVSVKGGTEENV